MSDHGPSRLAYHLGMNFGGIGYIGDDHFLVPEGLLYPLHLGSGAHLYGLYYPTPSRPEYSQCPILHDFMLTPVPPRYWPACAEITILLRHEPQMLESVARFLSLRGVSILNAECTRAAHRYATWNLTVGFDNLVEKNEFVWNTKYNVYAECEVATERLLRELTTGATAVCLYKDRHDPTMQDGVAVRIIRTLPFFHHHKNTVNPADYAPAFQLPREMWDSFCLRVDKGKITGSPKGHLIHRLRAMNTRADGESLFPSCFFVETDTFGKNLRLAIIPRNDLSRFFSLSIKYTRADIPTSTRGLISNFVSNLPQDLMLWRICNKTGRNEPMGEDGLVHFCFESPKGMARSRVEQSISLAVKTTNGQYNGLVIDPETSIPSSIDPNVVRDGIQASNRRRGAFQHDVFISYKHSSDGKTLAMEILRQLEASGMSVFLDQTGVTAGDDFVERLKQGLLLSREVCLIWDKQAKDSEWVTSEWATALALDKLVIPILLDDSPLPNRLVNVQYIKLSRSPGESLKDLQKYAELVRKRSIEQIDFELV